MISNTAESPPGRIKKLTGIYPGLFRALIIFMAYAVWAMIFRLLSLTFITYMVMSSVGQNTRFEDVNEAYSSGELIVVGLAALTFVALMRMLNPLTTTTTDEIFTPQRFEKRFLPGFMNGAVLASGMLLAFLMSGNYRYLGYFIQFDEAPLTVAGLIFKTLSLGVFVYCEEFIFRHKILRQWWNTDSPELDEKAPAPYPTLLSAIAACAMTGVFYVTVKFLQFDLGWMQGLTVFLISIALGMRTLSEKDFTMGAGFLAAILIVFHPLFSLPIFGNDLSGLVLIKYQPTGSETFTETIRFLSGGAGGPLASLALQLFLVFDIARGTLRYKKILLRARGSR